MTHGKCLAVSVTLGQTSTPLASGFLSCETKDAFIVHGRGQRTLPSCLQVQPHRLPELVHVLRMISCLPEISPDGGYQSDSPKSTITREKFKKSTMYSHTESEAEHCTRD